MSDRILRAHFMIHFGKAVAGFAAIFVPVQLTMNDYANPPMTLWTMAFVLITLAWGGLGVISNMLGDTLLWKMQYNLSESEQTVKDAPHLAPRKGI
ncbi:hypothetical protein [Brucella intermedia]|uniref:hypothetical protein n=1 Tax=Brucella intermedia TaxID=94625 RepID=UPI00224AA3A8|nr:hypothetical protein [Brucella intermedia]